MIPVEIQEFMGSMNDLNKAIITGMMGIAVGIAALLAVSTPASALFKYKLRKFKGVVSRDFAHSARQAGVSKGLQRAFRHIFRDHLDIRRDGRPGDRWRFTIRQRLLGGRHVGWLAIEAAEYVHRGHSYRAVRYQHRGQESYYFPDGRNMHKHRYLLSPLHSNEITSKFHELREHPVFKVKMPHNGVDFRARAGTKVMSVGDGRVVNMGYNRFSGNFVTIKHNSTDHSIYCHLSGFARGMRKDKWVLRGDVLGYVGATGVATGAHLHFSFRKKRRYINPETMLGRSAAHIPAAALKQFRRAAAQIIAQLP